MKWISSNFWIPSRFTQLNDALIIPAMSYMSSCRLVQSTYRRRSPQDLKVTLEDFCVIFIIMSALSHLHRRHKSGTSVAGSTWIHSPGLQLRYRGWPCQHSFSTIYYEMPWINSTLPDILKMLVCHKNLYMKLKILLMTGVRVKQLEGLFWFAVLFISCLNFLV